MGGEVESVRSSSRKLLQWKPQATTADRPIPVVIKRLIPASYHMLADVMFFDWYRSKMDALMSEHKASIKLRELEDFDLMKPKNKNQLYDSEMRQQLPSGSVVSNVSELQEGARRMVPQLRKVLSSIGGQSIITRIKATKRCARKAHLRYASRSPGPAVAWVHDALTARISLPTEDAIFDYCQKLKDTQMKILSVQNHFAKPFPSGYRSIIFILRIKYPSKLNNFFFCAKLEITLAALHDFTFVTHLCPGVHLNLRDYFQNACDDEEKSFAFLRQVICAQYKELCNSKPRHRAAGICEMLDNIRTCDNIFDLRRAAALLEIAKDFEASVPIHERVVALTIKLCSDQKNQTEVKLWSVLLALGNALLESRRYFKAVRVLRQAADTLTSSPNDEDIEENARADINEKLGLALLSGQRFSEAEDILQSARQFAIRRNARLGQIAHNLGYCAAARNDFTQAETFYQEAAKIRYDACGVDSFAYGITCFNLANTLASNGNMQDATSKYDEALSVLLRAHRPNTYLPDGAPERYVVEACALNYSKLLIAHLENNIDKARAIFCENVRSLARSRINIMPDTETLSKNTNGTSDDESQHSNHEQHNENHIEHGVEPYLLNDEDFETYVISLSAAPDLISFRATDDFHLSAVLAEETKISQKKKKPGLQNSDKTGDDTGKSTCAIDTKSECFTDQNNISATQLLVSPNDDHGLRGPDDHRTTNMVVMIPDAESSTLVSQVIDQSGSSHDADLTQIFTNMIASTQMIESRRQSEAITSAIAASMERRHSSQLNQQLMNERRLSLKDRRKSLIDTVRKNMSSKSQETSNSLEQSPSGIEDEHASSQAPRKNSILQQMVSKLHAQKDGKSRKDSFLGDLVEKLSSKNNTADEQVSLQQQSRRKSSIVGQILRRNSATKSSANASLIDKFVAGRRPSNTETRRQSFLGSLMSSPQSENVNHRASIFQSLIVHRRSSIENDKSRRESSHATRNRVHPSPDPIPEDTPCTNNVLRRQSAVCVAESGLKLSMSNDAVQRPDEQQIGTFPPGSYVIFDDKYRGIVEDMLGSGQFGTVHRFCDVTTNPPTLLALKSLTATVEKADNKIKNLSDRRNAERLERMLCEEAAINFAIGTHPNLVSMRRVLVPLPSIVSNFSHVLVLSDLVQGQTLTSIMGVTSDQKNGRVRTNCLFEGPLYVANDALTVGTRIVTLVAQLYLGIHHMHQRAVLHQDIKPDNCLVTSSYWLRITDYGLSTHARKRGPRPGAAGLEKQSIDEQVEPTVIAPLKGGSPAYMSPEAMMMLEHAHGAQAQTAKSNKRSSQERFVTPATSDLWSAAVITLELYARRAFKRSVLTPLQEFERLQNAADASKWSVNDVAEWAKSQGFSKPQALVKRKIDGPTLGSISELKLISVLSSAVDSNNDEESNSIASDTARELVSLRSTLIWQPIPDAVAKVIKVSLQDNECDRFRTSSAILSTLGCDVFFGQVQSMENMVGWDAVPEESKSVSATHDEDDVRETLGNIAKLFASHERWSLALSSYAEWIGVTGGDLRKEAVDLYCSAFEQAETGTIRYIDLSRQVKEYWRPLETEDFTQIFATLESSAHNQQIYAIDLHRQDLLDCTLQPLLTLRKVRVLSLAHCANLRGDLDPLADMLALEHLDLTGCELLEGSLDYLASCTQLRRLLLDDCYNLKTTFEVLKHLPNLQMLRANTNNKMLLTGSVDPINALTQIVDLQLQECRRLTGKIESAFTAAMSQSLVRLDLSHTKFEGELSSLSKCESLQYLILCECSALTGELSAFKSLVDLLVLDVSGCCNISGSLESLSDCQRLTSLNLQGCIKVEGTLDAFSYMAELELLVLDGCKGITGTLEPLSGLPHLEHINISATALEGTLDPLSTLTTLKSLYLNLCEKLGGTLDALGSCTELRTLYILCNNSLTDFSGTLFPLAKCTKLERLSLINSKMLTGNLGPIYALSNLEELDLNGCSKLTGGLEALGQCTNLVHLNLAYCTNLKGEVVPLAELYELQLCEINLQMCKQIQDLKEFTHYQAKYPTHNVAMFLDNRTKTSESNAERAKKFLGY